jgi:thymidylate synthase
MNNINNVDAEYFKLLNNVLTNGRLKKNRTGIDTLGVFGAQAKFDVNLEAFPILTTKKVYFRAIVHELLWFISGNTNIKYFVDNDVRIWDEWAYAKYKKWFETAGGRISIYGTRLSGCRSANPYTQDEFVQKIKEDVNFAKQFGELGEGTYGGMWRAFPYFYEREVPNPNGGEQKFYHPMEGIVDQLKKVVDKLKTNPDDRRMIVSSWHPYWVDHCALPPCHCLFQFHTEELTYDERFQLYLAKGGDLIAEPETKMIELFDVMDIPNRRLNCLLYQRSCDLGLGVPFNITSYCLLTAMVAHVVNMVPGVFTHTYGDLHIYVNHMDGVKEQLLREPMKLPELRLNPEIKSLFDFKYDDIKLIDYGSHPTIKMDVAV